VRDFGVGSLGVSIETGTCCPRQDLGCHFGISPPEEVRQSPRIWTGDPQEWAKWRAEQSPLVLLRISTVAVQQVEFD
jgi:hypothetical protein